jgi:hypothetical protein
LVISRASLAARHIPEVYSNRAIVEGGGLISYGPLICFQAFSGRSPFPLLDMTTTASGLLCWLVFHPREWQLASCSGSAVLLPRPCITRLRIGNRTVGWSGFLTFTQCSDGPPRRAIGVVQRVIQHIAANAEGVAAAGLRMIDIGPDHQLAAVVVREKLDAPGALLGLVIVTERHVCRQRIKGERRERSMPTSSLAAKPDSNIGVGVGSGSGTEVGVASVWPWRCITPTAPCPSPTWRLSPLRLEGAELLADRLKPSGEFFYRGPMFEINGLKTIGCLGSLLEVLKLRRQ